MDREKVIWDIERCICHVPDACRDCSKYSGEVDFDPIPCMEALLSDALALLKEQEPVKPYRDEEWPNGEYACGCCAQALFDKGKLMRPRFCPWCGRKVKWDA